MKKNLLRSPLQFAFILLLAGGLLTACNNDDYNEKNSSEDSIHNEHMVPDTTGNMGADSMMMHGDTNSMRRTPIDSGNRITPN